MNAACLLVHDVHGESLVSIGVARQGNEHPVAVALRFGRPAVDIAAPEVGVFGQQKALELFLVVFDHERRLREHLAGFREHGRDLRAVGHGFEDGFGR